MKPAGLSDGEDALDPAVSLIAFSSLASLAPEHAEPDHSLGKVVGRIHPLFRQENKEGVHLFFQPAGKRPRFARAVPIQSDKVAKPCIKGSPFSNRRRSVGHFHQPLQLTLGPYAKACKFAVGSLCKAARFADKMRQAGLSSVHPRSVNPV